MNIKTVLLSAIILVFNHQIIAQAPDWTRLLQVSTYPAQSVNVVTADGSNNYYFSAGISGPVRYNGVNYTSTGTRDLLVSKVTNAGAVQWAKQFNAGADGSITGNTIISDDAGNIFISGSFTGTLIFGGTSLVSSESINSFMLKFDQAGNPQWSTGYLATGSGVSKIALDASGYIYLLSSSSKLIKFSPLGSLLWEQSYANQTLQAIDVYGSNLYLGGTLKPGDPTYFGSIPLSPLGGENTGFLVRANLDGIYNNSLVVNGSTSGLGSSVADIIADNSGNLIITGCYTSNLGLGLLSNSSPSSSYRNYLYLAKCNSNFVFEWMTSSSLFYNYPTREMLRYRLFLDIFNNIRAYGQINTSFTWDGLDVNSSAGQYLICFDQTGGALYFNNLSYSSAKTIYSDYNGDIVIGGSYNYENSPDYGNFNLAKYDPYMAEDWVLSSSNSSSGTIEVSYIKHDSKGNTYIQARAIGKCVYFGNAINSNESLTVISKHDTAGNILWMKTIKDIQPDIMGCGFTLDKDDNVLTIGLFTNELQIETQTLVTPYVNDGYVAKYTKDGTFVWASKIDIGTAVSIEITVASDNAGNVIVSGVRNPDNYLIKFNPSGNKIWEKILPMASEYISFVSTDGSNNIYLSSEIHLDYMPEMSPIVIDGVTLTQSDSEGSTALFKFNPDGIAQWGKLYGGVAGATYPDGWPCDMDNDAAGNTYLWGWCRDNSIFGATVLTNPYTTNQNYSYYLAKINSSGDVVWAKGIYEKRYAFNYGNMQDLDENGNIYVGGHFNDAINIDGVEFTPTGTYDNFTAKFDNNGVFKWIKTIPAASIIINSLDVKEEDVLSLGGIAGKDPALGAFSYEKKGGSTAIAGTMGTLKAALFEDISAGLTFASTGSGVWGDYDNDGDLDILLTGDTGSESISLIYRNDNEAFTDIGAVLPGVYNRSATWNDYDNDGDLDILLTGYTGSEFLSRIYKNDEGVFIDISAGLPNLTSGSSVDWGDYDNDGDLDILLAGQSGTDYISRIYRNDDGTFTDISADLPGIMRGSVAWGDYDNDGDLDILLTGEHKTGSDWLPISRIYRNEDGVFTDIDASLPGVGTSSVSWGDYDNDGDLDILLTGNTVFTGKESISRIYRNDKGIFTDIGADLPGVLRSAVAWGDYDNDGDLDILLTGSNNSGSKISRIYRNGGGVFTDIIAGLPGVFLPSVAWGDYDNDGDLDILLTGDTGSGVISKIYLNTLNIINTKPEAPSNLTVSLAPRIVTLSWDEATDDKTPQKGLSYNLYIGTSPEGEDIRSSMATIPDGKRKIVLRGYVQGNSWQIENLEEGQKYYWSVQAIDNSYTGSAFAAESSFTFQVPPPPVAVAATNIGLTSMTTNWSASEGATGYRLDISTTADFATFVTNYQNVDAGNVTTADITGLAMNTMYYSRVWAYNGLGTSTNSSNVISVRTLAYPHAVPDGLSPSSCNGLVVLTWNAVANPDNNFQEYRIFGGNSPDPVTYLGSTPEGEIATTTYTTEGLNNGETYYFRIKAVGTGCVESDFSQAVQVKVKTGVIPVIKAKWDKVLICYNIGDSIASFQWYDGANAIEGATNQYFVAQNPGTYTVVATDIDGCQNPSNSINVSLAKSLTIYPNPATGKFHLDLNSSALGKTVISLYNSSGVRVLESVTDKTDSQLSDEIYTGNLRAGVYTLQVVVNNQETSYLQLMIIK